VARRKTAPSHLPKARNLRRSRVSRTGVTRREYNRIIDILNERNLILNALREGFQRLEHTDAIQFKRIAQLQSELDEVKRAWTKMGTNG